MRLFRMAALAVALTLTLCAAEVTGTWKGAFETQMGLTETTIVVQSASPLAGTVKISDFEGKIEKGKLEGDRIAFQITIEHGTVLYEGTVAGDEMKLTVVGPSGNKYPFTAKRQK